MENYGTSIISVGPWGGTDGGYRWDDGVYSGIRQLVVAHGAGIDSIHVEYDDRGCSVWSDKHGGSGGIKIDKVKLGYPDEFLTSIQGHYGSLNEWGPVFIRSLTFESNKRTYGPYGIEQGILFSFPLVGGKIVGFHGRCGWYLDAIGAYLEPIDHKPGPSKSLVQSHNFTNGTEKYSYSVVQGSLGNSYDIVLAFKQKNTYNGHSPNDLSGQPSGSPEFIDRESKMLSVPDSFERFPLKAEKSIVSYGEPKMVSVPNSSERFPSKAEKCFVSYGAWGGAGGTEFDDGIHTGVRQIHLSRNVGIVSITVLYEQNGETVWGSKNGGTGGFKSDKIVFDYPFEILTHLTGFYGPALIMGPTVIKSLTFHTTKSKYGPYGEEQGQHFTTNLKEGKIVGFHGRKGMFLDAIGVHVVEGKVTSPTRPPFNSSNQSEIRTPPIRRPPLNFSGQDEVFPAEVENPRWTNKLPIARRGPMDEFPNRVVKEPAPCETGPWGGNGGRPWDDGVFSGIRQIYLTRKEAIFSIQIEYDRNGQSVWSIKHGGDGGSTQIMIRLDHPHEVLTCISGFYGPIYGNHGVNVVKSLTFTTSRRKCGPYGEEIGSFFTSITTEGKVVGFHGRSGMYLDAIGVHMQHWLGDQKASKPSSLRKFFF